jgi:DNA-binding transcriptional ArsR family regulator
MAPTESGEDLDDCLRVLAHHTRRAILRLTLDGEMPAMQLAERLGIAPATASEHLRVLRTTGLVRLHASGTQRLYRADPNRIAAVIAALRHDLQIDD